MATKRKPIGNAKRFKTFQRDGFRCQYCGASPPAVVLHVDHVVAVANGGSNADDNLVTACSNCNHGKGTKSTNQAAMPRDYKLLAADTKERAEQLRAYREHLQMFQNEMHQAVDMVGSRFWCENMTWAQSASTCRRKVERFIELLGVGEVIEAAKIANAQIPDDGRSNQRFSYFCGVCWNRCTELGIRGDGRA